MCGFESKCVSLISSLLTDYSMTFSSPLSTSLWYHESHWLDLWSVSVAFLFPVSLTQFSTLDVPSTPWWLAPPPSFAFFREDYGFLVLCFQLSLPSWQNWPLEYSVGNCLTEVSYLQFSLTLKSVIYTLYTTLFPFKVKKWVTLVTLDKWTRTREKNLLATKWESWLHWDTSLFQRQK